MFYQPKNNDHGLPFNPFKAIVVPRPIGWISTRDRAGNDNLAPYSFFNAVSDKPPVVMFSSQGMKDSARNAEDTGVFACNFVSFNLRDAMNVTSSPLPPEQSEFKAAGLTPLQCELIDAAYVGEAATVLECETTDIIPLKYGVEEAEAYRMVIGLVVAVRIDDQYIEDGKLNVSAMQPLARMGYQDYAVIDDGFHLQRPLK